MAKQKKERRTTQKQTSLTGKWHGSSNRSGFFMNFSWHCLLFVTAYCLRCTMRIQYLMKCTVLMLIIYDGKDEKKKNNIHLNVAWQPQKGGWRSQTRSDLISKPKPFVTMVMKMPLSRVSWALRWLFSSWWWWWWYDKPIYVGCLEVKCCWRADYSCWLHLSMITHVSIIVLHVMEHFYIQLQWFKTHSLQIENA